MARRIVIVSDSPKAREALASAVRRRGAQPTLAANPDEALRALETIAADVVLVEVRRVDLRARRVRERIAAARPSARVVLITSFGGVRNTPDVLTFGYDDFLLGHEQLLDLLSLEGTGRTAADESGDSERAIQALTQTVDVLVGLVELSEPDFRGSSNKVVRLARAVAEDMGLGRDQVQEVVLAGLLKDIGRTGLDPDLLPHEGEFSQDQIERVREHVPGGVRLLQHIDFPWNVVPAVRHHHERYDGKGYPDGLKGREIPLAARIVAAADAFVAMRSPRAHRSSLDPAEAVAELERHAGLQFDPEVVEHLMRVVEKGLALYGGRERAQVLLCDPDEAFRKVLELRLANEGYDVRAVATPELALDAILASPPDLVLADAGAGAFDLLREIRRDASLQHVPFAFLASGDDRLLRIRALRQGVDDVVLRTGDLEELLARVENVLSRESARRGGALRRVHRGITGRLENLGLPDIVQTLAIGMKTACVALAAAGRTGKIWFRDGSIVHARCAEAEGESALFEMIRWREGEFVIEHGVRSRRTTIENDPMFLVMEGLRRVDEESASSGDTGRGER